MFNRGQECRPFQAGYICSWEAFGVIVEKHNTTSTCTRAPAMPGHCSKIINPVERGDGVTMTAASLGRLQQFFELRP